MSRVEEVDHEGIGTWMRRNGSGAHHITLRPMIYSDGWWRGFRRIALGRRAGQPGGGGGRSRPLMSALMPAVNRRSRLSNQMCFAEGGQGGE
jgi:hypothetical protein